MKFSREAYMDIGEIAAMMGIIFRDTPKEELKLILALMGADAYHTICDIYKEFTENPELPTKLASPMAEILRQEKLLQTMEEGDLRAERTSLDRFKGLITNAREND